MSTMSPETTELRDLRQQLAATFAPLLEDHERRYPGELARRLRELRAETSRKTTSQLREDLRAATYAAQQEVK